MREQRSFCRLCLATCGVVVTTDDEGRLVSVRGDRPHAATAGYACLTGLQSPEAHNSPNRILHPLKRMPDGSFARIPLNQAFDEIADRLKPIIRNHGGESIAAFRGTANYANKAGAALLPAWLSAIGSSAMFSTMTVDQSAKWVTAERLGSWAAGRDNFVDSDAVMLIGGNPLVSGTVMGFPCANPVKQIRDARARGLKLIVIDPRRSETAKFADIFLQPLPGEDVAVAAGLLRIILTEGWHDQAFCERYVVGLDRLRRAIEPFTPSYAAGRSGVPPEALRQAAEAFARTAKRGFAVTGTGPDMGPFSNLAEHLYECLNVLCGRFRRAGDIIVNPVPLGPRRSRRAEVIPAARSFEKGPRSRAGGRGRLMGERMSCELADEILLPGEGQIRSLFVAGGNPAGALPDPRKAVRAFETLDLMVTIDPFMTASAKLSHYILPPKLQYERPDFTGIHDMLPLPFVQYTKAVASPPLHSEAVDEWEIYWELAQRLGLSLRVDGVELAPSRKPATEELLVLLMRHAQLPLEQVMNAPRGIMYEGEVQRVEPGTSEARFTVAPDDVVDEIRQALLERPRAGFSHRLAVRRMRGVINTAYQDLPEIRKRHPYNPAYMHPDDLAGLGLRHGDPVTLISPYGEIPAIVHGDDTVRRGVVSMTHGWGKVLPDETVDYERDGASTCFLVSAGDGCERVNAMARLTGVPLNVVPRKRGIA